jgi:aspartate/methionine/tyrosine aminotransferase
VGDAGDEFILPVPYFFNQEMAVRMAGCVPVCVPTLANYQLDLQAIERAITPRTRAIITVSPNNPSGAVYHESDLRVVNALCARHGIYHFSDEAYEHFTFDDARHFSPGSIAGAASHTLTFHSFSKAFGLASWRVGYVVYPADLAQTMSKVQDTNQICAPVVSQLMAVQALKAGRTWLAPRLAALGKVRSRVHEALATLGDQIEFPRTQGAFYVLMKLPGVPDPLAFSRAMVSRHRVAAIPGFAFGFTDTAAANYQRLSFGALDENSAAQGVERFIAAVRDWYGP